jgi:O-antigen/teichoic acid export membrane protein
VRGTVALIARTIGLQALGFVAFIGLARLISPSDLGLFAIALGVQDVCLVIVAAGLPAALIRQERPPTAVEQHAVAGFTVLVALGLALIALLVGFAVLPAAGVESHVAELIAIACLALPILATRVIPLALLTRELRFELVARIDIITRVALYAWALAGAAAGFGVYALVSAIPVSAVVAAVLAARWQPWARGFSLDLDIVARHARFGFQVAGLRLLTSGFAFSAVAAFAVFGGTALAGFYGLSQRALGLPLSAVQALRRVGFPALARLDPAVRSRRAARVIGISAVGVSAPLAVVAGSAEPLVAVLFGARWLPAADIMILSAPGLLVFASVGAVIGSQAIADGNVRAPMIAVTLQIATTVGLAALLAPELEAVGAGVAMGTGYAIYAAALLVAVNDPHAWRAIGSVLPALVVAAGAVGLGQAAPVADDLAGLLIAGGISGTVWLALALLLVRAELFDLVRLLRRHMAPAPEREAEAELDPAAAEIM